MSNAAELLRMLEPTVRPDGIAGAGRAAQTPPPIEAQSFDAVLRQAQAMADDQEPVSDVPGEDASTEQSLRFARLSGIDRIDNAALRGLIARAAQDDGP